MKQQILEAAKADIPWGCSTDLGHLPLVLKSNFCISADFNIPQTCASTYCYNSSEIYKYHCTLGWFKRSVAQPGGEVGEWFGRPVWGRGVHFERKNKKLKYWAKYKEI
jgi:hypothetical protein